MCTPTCLQLPVRIMVPFSVLLFGCTAYATRVMLGGGGPGGGPPVTSWLLPSLSSLLVSTTVEAVADVWARSLFLAHVEPHKTRAE